MSTQEKAPTLHSLLSSSSNTAAASALHLVTPLSARSSTSPQISSLISEGGEKEEVEVCGEVEEKREEDGEEQGEEGGEGDNVDQEEKERENAEEEVVVEEEEEMIVDQEEEEEEEEEEELIPYDISLLHQLLSFLISLTIPTK